jgi:hypothetical protein
MTKNKWIFIIAILFVGVLGSSTFLGNDERTEREAVTLNEGFWHTLLGASMQDAGDELASDTPSTYITLAEEEHMSVYHHPFYGFSFKFPQELKVATFREGTEGEIVLVEDMEGGGRSFQIFINPFDEPLDIITPERIKEDLSDFPVEDPKQVTLGGKIHALLFYGADPALGRTREIWIIYNAYLYQISTADEHDKWLSDIMSTWRFDG